MGGGENAEGYISLDLPLYLKKSMVCNHFRKLLAISLKLTTCLSYDHTISFLGFFPTEMHMSAHHKTVPNVHDGIMPKSQSLETTNNPWKAERINELQGILLMGQQ